MELPFEIKKLVIITDHHIDVCLKKRFSLSCFFRTVVNMNIKLIRGFSIPDLRNMVISTRAKIISLPSVTGRIAEITNKKIQNILTIAVGVALHFPDGPI